jgi:multiple sugar transport system substrate-binding protein
MRKLAPLAATLVAGAVLVGCSSGGSTAASTGSAGSAGSAGSTGSAGAAASSGSLSTLPASQQVSITLASYMPTLGAAGVSELNSLVSGFEKAHPNIKVTIEPESNSAAIAGQVQQDEVSGHAPDVLQDTFNDLKFTVSNLGAADLTKLAGPAGLNSLFGGSTPYATAVTKLAEVNGDVYGVPWTLSTPILFYNSSLFTKAGITTAPATWSQVQADALAIKSKTGADGLVNGCIGSADSGTDWCLQALLDSNDGSVMNPAQTALTFDSPANVSALTTMQGLAKSGAMVNLSSAQTLAEFAAGKLGMILNTSALASSLLKAAGGHFTIKATELPGYSTAASVPTNSGSALFILSKSAPAQEASFELIQWLTSAAAETSITSNVGYPPLRPSIASMSQYLKSYSSTHQFLAPNLAQLTKISPWLAYPGPNYDSIATQLLNATSGIVFQGQDAASTLKSAQQQATSLLG